MLIDLRDLMHELAGNVRVADVLDVLLVTLFLYLFLTWIRQSAYPGTTKKTLLLFTAFTVVYVLARVYDLFLVETLLRVLFLVFLLGLVVVFQSDIRRMLDRIGTWSFSRSSPVPSAPRAVDILTEAAANMAEARTGALVAIKGKESWERHIQGGIRLDGYVSQPLLYSIFSPETPGHDGVVLMEGERISRFAAHLPLSRDLPQASQFGGTRHAAALGLAELSDAFVIVVSEERGTISVAEGGKLLEMENASELKDRLERFWNVHYTEEGRERPGWWSRRSLQTVALSFVLASMAWLLFAYRPGQVYRTYEVPIEFRNLPADWELAEPLPDQARVGLSGPEQAFRELDPASLVLSVNMDGTDEGVNTFTLGSDNLKLPPDLALDNVDPQTVAVTTRRLRTVRLAVDVQTSGSLPDTLELIDLRPEPAQVALTVPQQPDTVLTTVPTEPIDLSRIVRSGTVRTQLRLPGDVHASPDQSLSVVVHVAVRRKPPSP